MSTFHGEGLGAQAIILGGTLVFGLGVTWGQGMIADARYGADKAEAFIEQLGYTDVSAEDKDIVLVALKGCGRSDAVQYEFEATAPNGQEDVRIAVCKGLFKAATLRQATGRQGFTPRK